MIVSRRVGINVLLLLWWCRPKRRGGGDRRQPLACGPMVAGRYSPCDVLCVLIDVTQQLRNELVLNAMESSGDRDWGASLEGPTSLVHAVVFNGLQVAVRPHARRLGCPEDSVVKCGFGTSDLCTQQQVREQLRRRILDILDV